MNHRILECVPNFSEGRDPQIIEQIVTVIKNVSGVRLLHVDIGPSANRTVITFAGTPEAVVEAAFQGIQTAAVLIDMRKHRGEHPRMGATDVCPLIPISGMTMEEAATCAKVLGKRVAEEIGIPVYLYAEAAIRKERDELSAIRSGGYEKLEIKIKDSFWQPDYGVALFNERAGVTTIGARDFLLAYNINLNTDNVALAKAIASEIRTSGKIKKVNGVLQYGKDRRPLREPGLLPYTKAIGWYMEEYRIAQVSMNLVHLQQTPVHIAFETVCKCAKKKGIKVTGSEIIGLVPLNSMLEAGSYFMEKEMGKGQTSSDETERIAVAIHSLGLDELRIFDPNEKILEYALNKSK